MSTTFNRAYAGRVNDLATGFSELRARHGLRNLRTTLVTTDGTCNAALTDSPRLRSLAGDGDSDNGLLSLLTDISEEGMFGDVMNWVSSSLIDGGGPFGQVEPGSENTYLEEFGPSRLRAIPAFELSEIVQVVDLIGSNDEENFLTVAVFSREDAEEREIVAVYGLSEFGNDYLTFP